MNRLSTKSEGSEKILIAQHHFLDCCYWNPDEIKLYKVIDMILFVDSNASYLTAPGSKSRTGGFFYLGNTDASIINGSILYLTTIIKNVMASVAEAGIASLFLNARIVIPLRTAQLTDSEYCTIKQNKTKQKQ